MRPPFRPVTALLLGACITGLGGCVKQSTSYYIDGNQHTLTLRADQRFLWEDSVELTLIAARMPDCQRKFSLGDAPRDEVAVELYALGGTLYNLRAGEQRWQVDTANCSQVEAPQSDALGQPLGSFMLDEEGKMVFEAATAQPAAPSP